MPFLLNCSRTFGFISGITCAIMAVYILKKNKDDDIVNLIHSFFKTFAEW